MRNKTSLLLQHTHSYIISLYIQQKQVIVRITFVNAPPSTGRTLAPKVATRWRRPRELGETRRSILLYRSLGRWKQDRHFVYWNEKEDGRYNNPLGSTNNCHSTMQRPTVRSDTYVEKSYLIFANKQHKLRVVVVCTQVYLKAKFERVSSKRVLLNAPFVQKQRAYVPRDLICQQLRFYDAQSCNVMFLDFTRNFTTNFANKLTFQQCKLRLQHVN